MLFRPLPQGMQLLEAAVAAMDDPGIVPPPQDMASIGERMRRAYARSRARGYADLSKSEKRKLPFAYWVESDPVLSQVEPDLVRQYWDKHLPEALRATPKTRSMRPASRRPKRPSRLGMGCSFRTCPRLPMFRLWPGGLNWVIDSKSTRFL